MPRRTHLSVTQKNEMRLYYRAHPKLTHEDLIRWAQAHFDVLLGRSTVGSILRAPRDTSLNPRAKRNQEGRYPDMERQLYQFVLQAPDLGRLNDLALCAKANELLGGQESVTKSWVFRFKQRHAIAALRSLRKCVDAYEPRDVFNLDETSLFYQMEPHRPSGGSSTASKACVSVGLCSNMDGSEKLEAVVLHNQEPRDGNPRCIDGMDVSRLPVRLYCNEQPWMTATDFTDWLEAFNSLMRGRRVLLLVDNAPCHGVERELSNVRVHLLPPNSPAQLQPMRAGITQHFKMHFKTLSAQWMLDQKRAAAANSEAMTVKKMSLLTAIQHIVQAWQYVAPQTVRTCWAFTGIISGDKVALLQQQNEPNRPVDTSVLNRLIPQLELPEPMTSLEYIDVENDVAEWVPDISADELQPAPRSRRANQRHDGQEAKEEKENGREESKPLSHGEALTAAIQLSTYAFAQGIDAPGLQQLIESARERCRGSSLA
ncbi:hypothetical protein BBJ28_00003493 [Nothophytophthora sp. Chile5]|nr:hypothetical protein BBJ28_00003493 [Nothophytophthora sp. Chile5]